MKLPRDKKIHFLVCVIITILVGIPVSLIGIWSGIIAGSSAALSAGITKEYCDSKQPNNHWCWWDLLADALGVIVGIFLVWSLPYMLKYLIQGLMILCKWVMYLINLIF